MPEPRFEITVPDGLAGGAYANLAAVWHTPHEFTIDFGVVDRPNEDADGNVTVPVRVTSRVRLPISVVFSLLRALEINISSYEERFGPVPTGEELQIPPDLLGGEEDG